MSLRGDERWKIEICRRLGSWPSNTVIIGHSTRSSLASKLQLSGIGKAAAIALGQAGADVVVNYATREEDAKAVVEEIRRSGVRVFTHRADVSDENQVQEMFRRAIAELGTIDILVNNAGLQRDAPFHTMSLVQWNTVIAVNLTGQFLCAREAVREFLRRGVVPKVSRAAGKIICISSVHEIIPWAGHANYCASKGRRGDDDEDPRPGGCTSAHPRQQHRPGSGPHTDQHGGMEHARGISPADGTGPL